MNKNTSQQDELTVCSIFGLMSRQAHILRLAKESKI